MSEDHVLVVIKDNGEVVHTCQVKAKNFLLFFIHPRPFSGSHKGHQFMNSDEMIRAIWHHSIHPFQSTLDPHPDSDEKKRVLIQRAVEWIEKCGPSDTLVAGQAGTFICLASVTNLT